MKLIIFYLLLLTPSAFYAQEVQKIRIDPAQAFGGTVSEYFDSIEYILLETTKESLFGDINQMVITDRNIVIYDIDTRTVLFFTIHGKYIRKVSVKNAEYLFLSYNKDGNINISMALKNDKGSNLVEHIYSTKGLKIEQTNSFSSKDGLVEIDNDHFLGFSSCRFSKSQNPKDSTYYLLNIYKGDNIYKSFLPYNQKRQAGFCRIGGVMNMNPRSLRIFDKSVYISTPYEHLVYKVTKDTAIKMFQFIFPAKRSISSDILNSDNLQLIDSVEQQVSRNDIGIINNVINIGYHENKLLFKIVPQKYIQTLGSTSTRQYNFMYDPVSTKLVSMERLTPDTQNFFLPIIGNGTMVTFDGLYFYKGVFYTPISSLSMFEAYEQNKFRNPQYPISLQEYFKTQNSKSNPVIVKMKLK